MTRAYAVQFPETLPSLDSVDGEVTQSDGHGTVSFIFSSPFGWHSKSREQNSLKIVGLPRCPRCDLYLSLSFQTRCTAVLLRLRSSSAFATLRTLLITYSFHLDGMCALWRHFVVAQSICFQFNMCVHDEHHLKLGCNYTYQRIRSARYQCNYLLGVVKTFVFGLTFENTQPTQWHYLYVLAIFQRTRAVSQYL